MGLETSIEEQAELLARRLQCATDLLLQRLFAYLSQLPEEDTEDDDLHGKKQGGGMTLPAAAVGWLSSQYYPAETEDVCPTMWSTVALSDRLRLLRFLLPRVTHLRITRQVWPPELPKTQRVRESLPDTPPQQPPDELNCSGMSVSSALTLEDVPPRTTRVAFWHYMQGLQHRPVLDMRVFPRVQVLVLEAITPTWVSNLYSLQPTLQVLKWNRACLYDELPRLFARPPNSTLQASSTPARLPTSSLSQAYSQLTHLDLSHCGLGEASRLPNFFSKYTPNLGCLSLAHNDLISQKAAISGLCHSALLTKLNLSHNNLTALPEAHLALGGQLQRLQLSQNQLKSVQGLDRLYALEELWLDHNQLSDLSELAGVCQLPQLQFLQLQGNPLEKDFPQYLKQIWTWFQEFRQASTPTELPVLNACTISPEQWNVLVMEMAPTIRSLSRRVHRRQERRKARIVPNAGVASIIPITTQLSSPKEYGPIVETSRQVSFSLQDVLMSLHQAEVLADATPIDSENNTSSKRNTESANKNFWEEAPWEHSESEDLPSDIMYIQCNETNTLALEVGDTSELNMSSTANEILHAFSDKPNVSSCSATMEASKGPQIDMNMPMSSNGGQIKKATIKHETEANGIFDVMTSDWEALVEKVARGLIPDGKPRIRIPELAGLLNHGNDPAFPEEAAELLSPEPMSDNTPFMQQSRSWRGGTLDVEDRSVISSSFPCRSNALPDQIYPDDFSVPSSLGTNREDFPARASRFQIAEENAAYDGPDSLSEMYVLENLNLYFETYVFPSSLEVPESIEVEEVDDEDFGDDWQTVALRFPRIQLWPEDRRWQDPTSPSHVLSGIGSSIEIDDWAITGERYVRVWDEQVVPCGKAALRRLAPNRRIRLGFHGEQLFKEGAPDPYAECRKVYLCLSSAAFYILLQADDVTKKQAEIGIKKRFPNPIPDGSKFQDAAWPHAVARHTLHTLQAVTIGFEFQRLILQFSNPTLRKTDPFIYVLLTSNKKATVSILQDIQRLVKESKKETIDLSSDVAPVSIENDSQLVMDALQATVAPEMLGTIFHYQILRQRWKHGEGRGTVRRVCVVTDTKLFLMDEDYRADSHKPLDPPATGIAAIKRKKSQVDLANVSYRVVDEACLKQVSEVQAAGADPSAITIVINPLSRLSRTHRWRLICRDSVGAERLVEDVRRAIAMMAE